MGKFEGCRGVVKVQFQRLRVESSSSFRRLEMGGPELRVLDVPPSGHWHVCPICISVSD